MRPSKESLCCRKPLPAWHKAFLAMVPTLETHAQDAFRHLDAEARAEVVQEVVCNACAALARLVALKKAALASPSGLARFGVAQCQAGRQVGGRGNVRDASPPHCQREKGCAVAHAGRSDNQEEAWREVLLEDRHTGPTAVAASDPMTVLKGEGQ